MNFLQTLFLLLYKMRVLCIKEKNLIRVTIYTSKWYISVYHIFLPNDAKYTKLRTLQYHMHNSSKIRFLPSFNVQYQLWARIWPEITCKDTLGNSGNGISTLQIMHKNLKLTWSNNFISNIKSIISLSKNMF
jgi:hypothetical protein